MKARLIGRRLWAHVADFRGKSAAKCRGVRFASAKENLLDREQATPGVFRK